MAEFTKARMLEARERWPNITGPKSLAAAVQSDSDDLPDALDMMEKMAEAIRYYALADPEHWPLDMGDKARALLATWEKK